MAAPGARSAAPPVRLFALATGAIVLSLYVAQPLVGQIGPALGLSLAAAGLVGMLTLGGYAIGLFVLVPLCDRYENRRLVLLTLLVNTMALAVAAMPVHAAVFLATSFIAGLSASAIQMLVPMAAAMTNESQRGRVIGNIMSGLVLGVMLARPLASLVADGLGWRAVYGVLAATLTLLTLLLARALPRRMPPQPQRLAALLGSLTGLLREERVLRQRAASAALTFAAFNAFWSMVALRLSAPPFGFGAKAIAAFALVGVCGAVIAPIAGRLGDRGMSRGATCTAHAGITAALLLAWLAGSPWAAAHLPRVACVLLLGMAAILLDAGTIAEQVLGRRAVNLLRPEARGGLNGLYTGIFFLGGAAGSALAGPAWSVAGWGGICVIGLIFTGCTWIVDRATGTVKLLPSQ